MTKKLPELLCPAGDMDRLESALLYGADACYLGGKKHSLRASSGGFDWEELETACGKAHAKNASIYYTLNILPHEQHLAGVEESLEHLAESSVDGLIIADPGVLRMARRIAPNKSIHLSTQANTSNSEAVGFWHDLGIERVNVARELGAHAISKLTKAYPSMEFEVFVHGAMCLALSGRCLLSSWMNQRPANLGECTHPCRFEYKGLEVQDMRLTVEEGMREGPTWDITHEGPHSAFWAPEDLCLVKYMHWFHKNNVASLKIEGRMKTPSYVAHVVDVYRTAINDVATKQFRYDEYIRELQNTASRNLSTGFFLPKGHRKSVPPLPKSDCTPIVAKLVQKEDDSKWQIAVRSPFRADRPVQVMVPGLKRPMLPVGSFQLENHRGEAVDVVHPGMFGFIRCESEHFSEGLFLRG
jgi:putative protease